MRCRFKRLPLGVLHNLFPPGPAPQKKTKGVDEQSIDHLNFLVTLHLFCRPALNFETLLGGSTGGAASVVPSSCFLSSIVGKAGGAMVR